MRKKTLHVTLSNGEFSTRSSRLTALATLSLQRLFTLLITLSSLRRSRRHLHTVLLLPYRSYTTHIQLGERFPLIGA